MEPTKELYDAYANLLKEELQPAFGCTEPIAVAYCAARAREILGTEPKKVLVEASGNVIKNVKSVSVPNTGGKKGLPAAAAAGIVSRAAQRIRDRHCRIRFFIFVHPFQCFRGASAPFVRSDGGPREKVPGRRGTFCKHFGGAGGVPSMPLLWGGVPGGSRLAPGVQGR